MKIGRQMKTELLLDTHVWVWLVTGEPKLIKTEFFTLLEKAEDIRLHLSAISLWEISMLVSKERLKLSMNTLDWLKIYLKKSDTQIIAINPDITVKSTELKGFHGDPADRLILASAIYLGAKVVTHDKLILSFCKSKKIDYLKV